LRPRRTPSHSSRGTRKLPLSSRNAGWRAGLATQAMSKSARALERRPIDVKLNTNRMIEFPMVVPGGLSPLLFRIPGVSEMTDPTPIASRRDFLKTTGQVATASALAGVSVPAVHAAEDNTIRVALVGCGGRGTGAAGNALSTKQGPIKLVAMADVFKE